MNSACARRKFSEKFNPIAIDSNLVRRDQIVNAITDDITHYSVSKTNNTIKF